MLALTMILLLVLLSVVCKFRSLGYTGGDIRDYNSTGGANLSTLVKARGVSILNVGNSPLRFSKIGFYQTTDDAQSNQRELLGLNKTTVAFYTTGIANLLGDGVDIEPVGSYSEISNVSNISLLPGTALVIDFATDVSFRAVRLGKIDNFTDPTACRLQLSTSSLYQTIASAEFSVPKFMTFPSGDTQNNSFLKAGGLHVSPGGIFVVSTLSFRDIQASNVVVVVKKTGTSTIVIQNTLQNAEVLIVGGGGGGSFSAGGGGGAGGIVYVANATITAGTYSVTVGEGGSGATVDGGPGVGGSNTTAFGLTAHGGGGGAHNTTGSDGGCGGGSGYNGGTGGKVAPTVMSGTASIGTWVMYGNDGGNNPVNNHYVNFGSGGGGGVGSAGGAASSTYGGNGGNGKSEWSAMGIAAGVGHSIGGIHWFGGGGGGSSDDVGGIKVAGKGGSGGGGNGGVTRHGFALATNGLANTGGGGGGGCMVSVSGVAAFSTPPGGSGGSGA